MTAQAIDETASYARREADVVRLVFTVADDRMLGTEPTVRLVRRSRVVTGPATVTRQEHGFVVDCWLPAAGLKPGTWSIAVRAGESGPWLPVQARLLFSRTNPIALLPGPRPKTPPRPSRAPAPTPPPAARTRAAALVRRVLDRLPKPEGAFERLRRSGRATR